MPMRVVGEGEGMRGGMEINPKNKRSRLDCFSVFDPDDKVTFSESNCLVVIFCTQKNLKM